MAPSKREGILLDIFNEVSKLEGLTLIERVKEHERRARALGISPGSPSEDEDSDGAQASSNRQTAEESEDDSSVSGPRLYRDLSSDDDSDDEPVIIWTEQVRLPETSLAKRVYSQETLLSLIPEKPEFDKLREKLKIQKTVYRFDPSKSNRQYSSEYYKLHRCGVPKDHPRVAVQIRGDGLDSFYGKDRPFVKRGVPFGGKPQRLANKVLDGRVIKTRKVGTIPRRSFLGLDTRPKLLHRVDGTKSLYREFCLGWARGHPRATVPVRNHRKYWYFLRRNGTWCPSLHHPYGDEMEVYPPNAIGDG